MSRWFRHYAGMMRDEKLVSAAIRSKQSIERVVWVYGVILESAAETDSDGEYLIDHAEIAYFLRADEMEIRLIEDTLGQLGRLNNGYVVKWGNRQFASDKSATRQKLYRERHQTPKPNKVKTSRNVTITSPSRPSDAPESESETETDIRTPVPNGTSPAENAKAAVDAWNELAAELGLSPIQRLTEPRKRALALRLREVGGIGAWPDVLAKIRGSPFLLGDNDRGWKADFDFLMQPKSFTKLLEGAYDRKSNERNRPAKLTGFERVGEMLARNGIDPPDFDIAP